jgi:hypothetical protein
LIPSVDAVSKEFLDQGEKSFVPETLLREGQGEERFEFLGSMMLDEYGSRTAAGDLEAVAGSLRGSILVGGADELCDEVFDGREKLEKVVLAWSRRSWWEVVEL